MFQEGSYTSRPCQAYVLVIGYAYSPPVRVQRPSLWVSWCPLCNYCMYLQPLLALGALPIWVPHLLRRVRCSFDLPVGIAW